MFNKSASTIKTLFQRNGIVKVVENIGWLTIERFFALLLSLIVSVFVARYLGPEKFGSLNFVIAFAATLEIFTSLGLRSILIKRIVIDSETQFISINSAFTLRIIASLIIIPVGYFVLKGIKGDETTIMISYLILSSVFFRNFDVIENWFQALVKSKYSAIAKIISFSTYAVIRIILILIGASLFSFALAFLIEGIIRACGLAYFYFKVSKKVVSIQISKEITKDLIDKSWPLLFSAIAVVVYMKIDVIMLGVLKNDYETGLYAAVSRISEIIYNIPTIASVTFFPILLKSKKINDVLFIKRMQILYDILTPIMISVAIIISLVSKQTISVLFGDKYFDAYEMLIIHVWSGVFITFSVIRSRWIIAEDLQIYVLICQLLGAISNILLNFIFIPEYGGVGASYTTLISYFLATTGSSMIFKKLRGDGFRQLKSFFPFTRLYNDIKSIIN